MTARKIPTPGRSRPKPATHGDDVGERANDALTNLIAYALTLDIEYHRLDARVVELTEVDSDAGELRTVLRERDDIGAQREAFRRSVTALREQAGQKAEGQP